MCCMLIVPNFVVRGSRRLGLFATGGAAGRLGLWWWCACLRCPARSRCDGLVCCHMPGMRLGLGLFGLANTRVINPPTWLLLNRCVIYRGALKKVALTACMHKLLTIINAVIKSGKPWQAGYPQATGA
jgi:hypothetical protein